MHASEEQLESDDGVNDNDKQHQQGNVQQRHKRLHDRIEHYVQACGGEGRAQRIRLQPGTPPPTRGRIHLLGTPDTSLSGLSTLNARSAFTSKPPGFPPVCGTSPGRPGPCSSSTLNSLMGEHGIGRGESGLWLPPHPSFLLKKAQVPVIGNQMVLHMLTFLTLAAE